MLKNKDFIIEIIIHFLKAATAVVFAIIIVNILKIKILEISESLNNQKQAAYALEQRSQTIRQLQSDFKRIGPGEQLLLSARPDADNVVDFKASIEGIANRQGVESVVDFGLPNDSQTAIDYTVNFGANVNSLISYLKYFESLPYLTGITGIEINSGENNSWENSSRINLRGRVFTRPISN